MKPKDNAGKPRTKPQPAHPDSPERTVAPPIEREHETYEGALEEEERRERERHSPADDHHAPA